MKLMIFERNVDFSQSSFCGEGIQMRDKHLDGENVRAPTKVGASFRAAEIQKTFGAKIDLKRKNYQFY
jgi:hypothetical protein